MADYRRSVSAIASWGGGRAVSSSSVRSGASGTLCAGLAVVLALVLPWPSAFSEEEASPAEKASVIPPDVVEASQNAEVTHLLAAAQAAVDVGQLDKAEQLYRSILQQWPDVPAARKGLQNVLRGHQAGV